MRRGKSRELKPIVILLKGNNKGSIALTQNLVFYSRTEYINIQHYYIRDEVASKWIKLSYISIDEMVADGLINKLTHVKFQKFVEQMTIT